MFNIYDGLGGYENGTMVIIEREKEIMQMREKRRKILKINTFLIFNEGNFKNKLNKLENGGC